jgi:hypothetical protein
LSLGLTRTGNGIYIPFILILRSEKPSFWRVQWSLGFPS